MTTKPEATNSIHKPGAANGALASLSDARTNLPEYKRWQNAMRPEDTGHSDGAVGVPTASDQSSPFESMVRDQLSSRLGVVRNKFAQDDAILLGEISTIRPDTLHFQRLLDEKRAAVNRPVLIRLDRRSGFVGSAVATLLASTLMGILWLDKGIGHVTAGFVALFGAAISSVAAYACGLMLRQGQRPWHKWLAAGILGVMAAVGIAVCTNMRTPSFGNLQAVPKMVEGILLADVIASIGSMDFVLGDTDR